MNNEIQWFCHHAVVEGLLTRSQCKLIADAFIEQGVEEDLEVFVQTAIDNELCTDLERLKELANLALQEAGGLGAPPSSVFDEAGAGLHQPVEHTVPGLRSVPDEIHDAAARPSSPDWSANATPRIPDFVMPGTLTPFLGWPVFLLQLCLPFVQSEWATGACWMLYVFSLCLVLIDSHRLQLSKMLKTAIDWDEDPPLGWFDRQLAVSAFVGCLLLGIVFFPLYLARRARIASVCYDAMVTGLERGRKRQPVPFARAFWSTLRRGAWLVVLAVIVLPGTGALVAIVSDAIPGDEDEQTQTSAAAPIGEGRTIRRAFFSSLGQSEAELSELLAGTEGNPMALIDRKTRENSEALRYSGNPFILDAKSTLFVFWEDQLFMVEVQFPPEDAEATYNALYGLLEASDSPWTDASVQGGRGREYETSDHALMICYRQGDVSPVLLCALDRGIIAEMKRDW